MQKRHLSFSSALLLALALAALASGCVSNDRSVAAWERVRGRVYRLDHQFAGLDKEFVAHTAPDCIDQDLMPLFEREQHINAEFLLKEVPPAAIDQEINRLEFKLCLLESERSHSHSSLSDEEGKCTEPLEPCRTDGK